MANRLSTYATLGVLASLLALGAGCGDAGEADVDQPDDEIAWMQRHADDYLGDASWRRTELEASLWRSELPYARKQLSSYALEDGGWDLLPEIDARVAPVRADGAQTSTASLLPEHRPRTRREWLALGERVFWSMPMRSDAYLEWLVTRPDLWEEAGLQTREDGTLRGVVRFENARGDSRVAVTCGLCHGDRGRAGRAVRDLDLGWARAQFGEAHGADLSHLDGWPAGTVDVTDDGVADPLAIPDLWGVEHQSHINSSGVVEMASPAALAIRFETQYILGHSLEARAPRVLTWALATYVLSLSAPEAPAAEPGDEASVARGAELFDEQCASCHRPDSGYAGGLVDAAALSSDPGAAHSPFRGTGSYRVPSLLGAGQGGPYLHDASAPTLRDLLEGGHPWPHRRSDAQTEALVDFLETL